MKHLMQAMSLSLVLTSPITLGLSAIAQQSYENDQVKMDRTESSQLWGPFVTSAEGPGYFGEQMAEPAVQLFVLTLEEESEESPLQVAQASESQAYQAFFDSRFNYWDAAVLSKFWTDSISDTKVRMGRKILWGGASKAYLEQQMMDARIKALAEADRLHFFFDAGYDYDDAKTLAEFWGDSSPWEGKLRVERNIIMGNEQVVRSALTQARRR